jgi:hypothetical protein
VERASDKVLSALAALQVDPNWQTIKEWVLQSRDADVKALTLTKDEVSTRWLQGSIQTLDALLEVGDKAMGVLHRKRTE